MSDTEPPLPPLTTDEERQRETHRAEADFMRLGLSSQDATWTVACAGSLYRRWVRDSGKLTDEQWLHAFRLVGMLFGHDGGPRTGEHYLDLLRAALKQTHARHAASQ